jgi:polar amino acid transport system ATP-binding protein
MDATERPIVEVKGLVKKFGPVTVLKSIDFSMLEGELISIIGPSGCGKSTFLRCLNGLEVMDEGTVYMAGNTMHWCSEKHSRLSNFERQAHDIRSRVGMVFQSFNLFPHKTVLENVMLAPMVVNKVPAEEAEANAHRLLAKVGLADFANRYPSRMSGGQQQRAAIARALALAPKVMLYDEPTSALDPQLVDEVLRVMRDLDAEGMTQIVVTHEIRFAKDASDYIVYMEHGEIVEISDEDEIFVNPKDERTRKFLQKFM